MSTFPQPNPAPLPTKDLGRLLLSCADRPGLVAAVSAFLSGAGANIISLDQHSTAQTGGTFMQRTIFHMPGLPAARDALQRDFREQVAAKFDMDFRLTEAAKPKRVAILASREDHCLLDLLWRNRRYLFAIAFPFYIFLCCATVYIQAHYLVDVFGGLVTALIFFKLTDWTYTRWRKIRVEG